MNYKIGICAMLMLFLSACKNNQSDAEIEKAKAIVWVDKHGEKDWKDYGMIRTAKARVYVYTYRRDFPHYLFLQETRTGSGEIPEKTGSRLYHSQILFR